LVPTLISSPQDVVFSDELNHASIIDGIRLSKGEKRIYPHNDMEILEKYLKETKNDGLRMIITDGVFSMEGDYAKLPTIVKLAEKYNAFVAVDDSHAVGFIGKHGRGTPEYFGVKVDIHIGTLGKALGGACGGYIAGSKQLIDYLTQKSRPYIFSNALPPAVIFIGLAALDLIQQTDEYKKRLEKNSQYFRDKIKKIGYKILGENHPIVPILIGETPLTLKISKELLNEGVYICGFGFPVVPEGKARLRAQISAAHTIEDLDFCLQVLEKIGKKYKIV